MIRRAATTAILGFGLLLAGCISAIPEPESPAPSKTIEEVWTQPLTGSSAAVLAASKARASKARAGKAREGIGHIAWLAALEDQVAQGVEQGRFSETDLAQVRARRARAEARLAQTIGDLGRAKARFDSVIGGLPTD